MQESDPYNNVIRTTVEAMAAVLGGTQSLHTNALDEAIALPTEFSARIARNTQIVLAEETGITKVVDPLGGSYYVEALTSELVDQAWQIIGEVDGVGGMTKAVASGMPKRLIEEASAARQARVDKGEDVIVGVNKYRPENAEHIDFLDVDNVKVREGQVARIKATKAARDEVACQAALAALTEGARYNPPRHGEGDHGVVQGAQDMSSPSVEAPLRQPKGAATSPSRGGMNLLALAITAARARATLGEISDAMELVFGRYATTPEPVRGIYGSAHEFDAAWARVTARGRGHRPPPGPQAPRADRQDGAGRP